ncbi:Polyphosphoinositide phosphatase [Brachionus plicatilis]|uniref:Polyphosphoinositide phosphatase n=1 Tax=Brachionus plicatilis TaxID=10195 RepID=A0A3M7S646_BRAPC|nr:Polyphosphoinositide phosphatase [Brachionus plicatilis]
MEKNYQTLTYPLINLIQKITVYETNHSFYMIGSNSSETLFRVIKLDRTCDPKKLSFSEDIHEYDQQEIKELISMINIDNLPGKAQSNGINNGIVRQFSAHFILGFVKFVEGYYMILVTKQLPVAILGYHVVYTIEDVVMVYIPYVEKSSNKEVNQEEQRYVKMFQTIDLRQNFYYSYTYDLTHTMQHNFSSVRDGQKNCEALKILGVKNKPSTKFMWNEFLLEPVIKKIDKIKFKFKLNIFLNILRLNIFGCTVFVTLIARRSQKYAGTRFLKRGGTNEGYVANEVETEQIVHNGSISSFEKGYFTSFVHTRGSIPCFWSQDPKAVPKPPIVIGNVDPFATVAARHFKQLFSRFGAPVIILNLVKMREKKPQESILANEYKLSLDYLKQFLPNQNFIDYICFDMAKFNKIDKGNVMKRLYDIAESCISKTKFFKNFDNILSNEKEQRKYDFQAGIVRVNCVDCLDRTNTAMYVIGKCALAHQLYALGILSTPSFGVESLCEKMLIDLYEKCGDAIAQQYGGSQLVHRVDTYGKNSIASQSRDMIHTISRYYSNAFSDADKQNAINLFLGIFQPKSSSCHIWELNTDCYLHDSLIMQPYKSLKNYIEWIDLKLFECLPMPYEIEFKSLADFMHVEPLKSKNDPKINLYDDFYTPNRLTAFHEIFYFNNLSTNRIANNLPSQGFTGNIMAILDPFKFKKKSFSGLTNSAKNLSTESMLLNSSSDDDFTDDSNSFVPDFSLKANNSEKPLSRSSPEKKARKIYEVPTKSLNVYMKYAEDAQRIQISYKHPKDKVYQKFFVAEQLCQDPLKTFSDKNLAIYEDHLNIDRLNDPTTVQIKESNLKIYEAFINERKNLKVNYDDFELSGFEVFNLHNDKIKLSRF